MLIERSNYFCLEPDRKEIGRYEPFKDTSVSAFMFADMRGYGKFYFTEQTMQKNIGAHEALVTSQLSGVADSQWCRHSK